MKAENYKGLNIIRASSGDWRIVFEYEIPDKPGTFKKFYVRDGINYVKDPEEKEIAAVQLRDDIELALKNGYNPFLPQITFEQQLTKVEQEIAEELASSKIKPWSIKKGEEEFNKYGVKKNLSSETMRKYKSYFQFSTNG